MSTVRIQLRRGTAAQWTSVHPVLAAGEVGFESDTRKMKVGDGTTDWTLLDYVSSDAPAIGEIAQDAINSALVAGTGLDKTYDDVANTITIDIDSTVATLTGIQTLTNKTLTTPTIGSFTNATHDHSNSAGGGGLASSAISTALGYTPADAADVSALATSVNTTTLGATTVNTVDLNATGDIVIDGNLTVNGDTTSLDTLNLLVKDNEIILNHGITGAPSLSAYLRVNRGTSNKASIKWNETIDKWEISSNDTDFYPIATTTDILTHNDATTGIHGITNTADLATKNYADAALSTHADDTSTHGTSGDIVGTIDTQTLTNKTLTFPKINENVTLNATSTELNVLGGMTSSTSELNILDGATLSTAELNILHGATLSTTELNYVDGVTSAIQTQIDSKAPIASPTFTGTVSGVTKTHVGLANVDNTSDANKPVSTATQIALDAKLDSSTAATTYAPLASPTFTGTVSGVTKSMVGLSNVDNTSDTSKPISTATQIALDAKLDSSTAATTYAPLASPTFTGTVSGVTKTHVGLANVDNTSDANKPVSTATQTALDLKSPIASPTFTGTPVAPTAASSTNTTQIATTEFVKTAVDNLINGAGAAYDTLKELSDLIIADESTASSLATTVGNKAPKADPTFTGTVTLPLSTAGYVTTGSSGIISSVATIPNSGLTNSSITINGTSVSLGGTRTLSTTDISEGTGLYFTDERAQDSIGNNLGTGLSYNDSTGAIYVNTSTIQERVSGVTDTEIGYLDGVTSSIQTQINSKLESSTASTTYAPLASPTFTGTVTLPSGTVTSSMIADSTIVNADISSSAAIELSKLATDPLARANHTGTQTASTISDFDTRVRTSKVTDLTAPTGSFSMNSQKITNLGTPTTDYDAATKAYVDAAVNNINVHESVVAATTANVNLTNAVDNGKTLDGVTLSTGNRILVKNQSTASANGIYIVASNGAPTRATDYDAAGEVSAGDFIFVKGGTVNANTGWIQTADVTTVGTDSLTFTQFSGAGTYTANNGLTLSGTTFSINTAITADLTTAQTLTNKTLTSPTLTTPALGVATATSINGTSIPSSATLITTSDTGTVTNTMLAGSIANNKLSNSTTTIGSTEISLGSSATTIAGLTSVTSTSFTGALTGNASTVTNGVYTTDTGTVTNTMLAGSIAPSKISGTAVVQTDLASNVLTFLGTPTSANLAAALTDETGSTSAPKVVFSNTPAITSPLISTKLSLYTSAYIEFEGSTLDGIKTVLTVVDPTIARTITLPNATGTVVLKDSTDTLTNKTFDTAGTGNSFSINGTAISAVTGTGSAVLSASPTFTGTVGAAALTTTGNVIVGGDLTVNGTTTTVNSSTLAVADSNIEIAKVASPTDVTANGAGITIKGATDKTLNWYSSTSSFISSENIDLASGKTYKINGTTVLSATAVGGQTIPASTIVGLTDTQTLTNKTLTSPVIATIVNSGTLTLPTSTDTLVGKATTDTFTNKTFNTASTGNSLLVNSNAINAYTGTGSSVVLATSPSIATPTITGAITLSASGAVFTDGTQTKEGTPSRTPVNAKLVDYTAVATDRDSLLDFGGSVAQTITIPANASVAFPIGTSIDVLQSGTGQVTVAGAAGVTVNGTPGLKLRAQWSSCTLFKRSTDSWVVMGDLTA